MLVTTSAQVTDYDVIDPDINFSDHLSVIGSFNCVASRVGNPGYPGTRKPGYPPFLKPENPGF